MPVFFLINSSKLKLKEATLTLPAAVWLDSHLQSGGSVPMVTTHGREPHAKAETRHTFQQWAPNLKTWLVVAC